MTDLLEVLDQVRALLERKQRVTYRMLKAQFRIDDESLETLKDELIKAERVATNEGGEILVWTGDGDRAGPPPDSQPPATYTPPHLAVQLTAP